MKWFLTMDFSSFLVVVLHWVRGKDNKNYVQWDNFPSWIRGKNKQVLDVVSLLVLVVVLLVVSCLIVPTTR